MKKLKHKGGHHISSSDAEGGSTSFMSTRTFYQGSRYTLGVFNRIRQQQGAAHRVAKDTALARLHASVEEICWMFLSLGLLKDYL